MSEVTVTIGRRNYTVACTDGQEEHVRAMGAEVDERLRRLGNNQSTNDAKNILFAAIILADELFELRRADPAPPTPQARAAGVELSQAQAKLAALEEELTDAREEQERLRQHLANVNERLAKTSDTKERTALSDEDLPIQLEALANALEKAANVLEGRA